MRKERPIDLEDVRSRLRQHPRVLSPPSPFSTIMIPIGEEPGPILYITRVVVLTECHVSDGDTVGWIRATSTQA